VGREYQELMGVFAEHERNSCPSLR